MSQEQTQRYIGLDVHKAYVVVVGVDSSLKMVIPYRRIDWPEFEEWVNENLTSTDAVALEVTTNAYHVHDMLVGKVQSVTVVHAPHVKALVKAPVKTDRRAALILAKLLSANLLEGIWIPPQNIRDLRVLVSHRHKMTRLAALAKNRLHSVLHRHHLDLPPGSEPFNPKNKAFWLSLPIPPSEQHVVQVDWATVEFAEGQKALLDQHLTEFAASDERVPLLIQLPGFGVTLAVTVIAAIGDITRFPSAKKLVGYAGLGARVHVSGKTSRHGGITRTGRKDLRYAMVMAAFHAVRKHPYWKKWYQERLPRLGKMKAQVAVARKMLIVVWHVLTKGEADRHAEPLKVARAFFSHAYDIQDHLPADQRKLAYVRYHLDRLGLGKELTHLPWGSKNFKLPEPEIVEPG